MLDAVTNGESFEDFAIDSDDDDNLQDLDLGNDLLGETEGAGDENEKKHGVINSPAVKASDSDTIQVGENVMLEDGKKSSENDFEHPLQMTGVGGIDPLSQFSPEGAAQAGDAQTSQKSNNTSSGVSNSAMPTPGGKINFQIKLNSVYNM